MSKKNTQFRESIPAKEKIAVLEVIDFMNNIYNNCASEVIAYFN